MKAIKLLLIFLIFNALAQPPTVEFDKRIVASDFFKDEYGDNYNICEVSRLSSVTNVSGPFSSGQCLRRNSANTGWVGQACTDASLSIPDGSLTKQKLVQGLQDEISHAVQYDGIDVNNLRTGAELQFSSESGLNEGINFIAGSNVQITSNDDDTITISSTGSGGGGSSTGPGKLIALDSLPTDLSSYDLNQVERIHAPAPGSWQRVNQFTAHGHAVNLLTEVDQEGANVTNLGVSLVGSSKFGSVETIEGTDLSVTESPVLQVIFQADLGGAGTADDAYTVDVLLKKSDIDASDQATATIYMATYSGTPSETTFIDVFPLAKQSSDVTEDGIVGQEYTFTMTPSRYNSVKAEHDSDAEISVEFYNSFATYAARGAVFDVLDEKEWKEIDKPYELPDYITQVIGSETVAPDVTLTTLSRTGTITARQDFCAAGTSATGIIYGGYNGSLSLRFGRTAGQAGAIKYVRNGTGITYSPLAGTGYNVPATSSPKCIGNATEGIIFGGWQGVRSNQAVHYSFSGNTITFTSLTATGTYSPRTLFAVVSDPGNINNGIIFGGWDGTTGLNDAIQYVRSGNNITYTTLTPMGLDPSYTQRTALEAVGSSTRGIIFGGAQRAGRADDAIQYTRVGNVINYKRLVPTDGVRYQRRDNFKALGNEREGVIFGGWPGFGDPLGDFVKYESDGTNITYTTLNQAGSYTRRNRHQAVGTFSDGIMFMGWSGNELLDDAVHWTTTSEVPVIKGIIKNFGFDDRLPLDTSNDFKVVVEEQVPGRREDRTIGFNKRGLDWTTVPFNNIRISYNNTPSEADLYLRYSVTVPLVGGDDQHHPAEMFFANVNNGPQFSYSLSYYETDAGQAVYRTPVVATKDRLTSPTESALHNFNILDAAGQWLFRVGSTTELKVVDRSGLQTATNSAQPVRAVPQNPREGQRIEPLNDIQVLGGAVMTAEEFSSSTAVYIGYLDASSRTQTTDLGSLVPENSNIAGLLSYPASHNNATFADKTVFQDRGSYNPTTSGAVLINGLAYAITNLQGTDYWQLTGLYGDFIKAGQKYFINVTNGSGTPLYPEVTLQQGKTYIWNGLQWVEEADDSKEVTALIEEKVPGQFRTPAVLPTPAQTCGSANNEACGEYIQLKGVWRGTNAQYTEETKHDGYLYIRN